MDENRNYQRGLLAGVAGGILGSLALMAIIVIVGINLFVANDGRVLFGVKAESPGIIENNMPQTEEHALANEVFLQRVNSIYDSIQENFLYEVDDEKLRNGMLEGMVKALDDPYSNYYSEEKLTTFLESSGGEYYGIGVTVSQNASTGIITVVKPFVNGPGYEAGLLPGDVIYAVNDVEVTGMELDQVVVMIKGNEGSSVKVSIAREGENDLLDFMIERRHIEIPSVEHEMLEHKIGYIAVSSFDGVTDAQFIKAYEELKEQGMQGVIIDLRNNGGGLLDTVTNMLDYLLPAGKLFYSKDKNEVIGLEYHSDAKAMLDIPLVVLVNGNSASASEVFAGNIQDFGAGVLVGTTTFGKGILQQIYYTDRTRQTAVKLTVGDYYIHSGRNIHKVGIDPDIEVELEDSLMQKAVIEKEEDNQLQKAIEVILEKMNP